MDIDLNKTLFTELTHQIQIQAQQSLSTLVDRAHQIDDLLNIDPFVSRENLHSISLSVHNHLSDFIELIEHLTIWLELEIPSYNDSDDYRISVQNEILDEIASIKVNSIASLSQFVDYREQRAIAKKELFKRSNFDDNEQLINYLDEQFSRNLKLMLIELKSSILRICHLLSKNRQILLQRTSTHVNNYF